MAFWGLEVKPGKMATALNIERRLVIKQAALVVEKAGKKAEPCVLSVSVGDSDQKFVVCRLHEGVMEQCPMELPFCPEDKARVYLSGGHTVHLTGFLDLDEDDDLNEMDDMSEDSAEGASSSKANGAQANGNDDLDDDEDDDEEDDGEEDDGEEDDGEEDDGEEDDGEEDDSEDDGDELDDDDLDDDEEDFDDESEEEEVPVPTKAGKRPAAAAPVSAKKAKTAPAATTPAKTPSKSALATPASKSAAATATTPNTWSKDEDTKLNKALSKFGEAADSRWEKVAGAVGSRSKDQCKKRAKTLTSGK